MKRFLLLLGALLGVPVATAIKSPVVTPPALARIPPLTASILSLRGGDGDAAPSATTEATANNFADTAAAFMATLCDVDTTKTAQGIVGLNMICATLLALSPEFAMAKIFKTGGGTSLSPNEKQLVENMGFSNLSTGVTSCLLLFSDQIVREAVALGSIPRFLVLAKHYILPTRKGVDLKLDALVPVYIVITALIASMFMEQVPIQPALAANIIGALYLLAGTVACLDPATTAKNLNYDSNMPNETIGNGILRSQGKTDMVNGGLLLGLGLGYGVTKAIGLSCICWSVAILLCDGILTNYKVMGSSLSSSFIQLVIAVLASKVLFVGCKD